ncbi:hypothetical protein AB0H71_27210 [Nocardia sp. NPDC050697]|uniref:hypothetical protein n=1 Tax=Nocardia sp. NPDC050697 TaxID=3155158 RepID=UPI0033D4758D
MTAGDAIAIFKGRLHRLIRDAFVTWARLQAVVPVSDAELLLATRGASVPDWDGLVEPVVVACLRELQPDMPEAALRADLRRWLGWWDAAKAVENSGVVIVPEPEPPRSNGGRLLALGAAVLVLVTAAVVVAVWPDENSCAAAGLTLESGECVGVADGTFPGLDPSVAEIVDRIAEQNRAVEGDAVEIALLGPLSHLADAGSPGQLDPDQVRRMLIGAAVAQQRVNTSALVRDPRPPVRLVLANTGSYQDRWQTPVRELVARADRPEPRLVATVLLGTSLDHTRAAAAELARAEMPMIGAITSAEEFNSRDLPGLIRTSPTSGDYVSTLAGYLAANRPASRAIVVWDQNSDRRGDLFAGSLKEAFAAQLGPWIGNRPEQGFVGAGIPTEKVWPQMFATPTINICQSGADVVLFAGRVTDLPAFIEALSARACRDRALLVMTGAAALTAVDRTQQQRLRDGGLTLVYGGVTDPHTWPLGGDDRPPGYDPFLHALAAEGFLADDADAYTCLAHDAVFTGTLAIRMASEGRIPPRGNVAVAFGNINSGHRVPGCSGELTFTTAGNGSPIGSGIEAVTIPYP